MDGWKVEQSSKQANHHEGSQRLKVDSDTLQQKRIPTLVNEKR
jgi:hypothetical protein